VRLQAWRRQRRLAAISEERPLTEAPRPRRASITVREYAASVPDISLRDALAFEPRPRTSRWRPGRFMSYSNAGPPLAAYAIERVTGRTFERYRATLGIPLEEEVHDGMPLHYGYALGDVQFAIHPADSGWPGVPTRNAQSPVIAFSTSDLKAVAKRLSANGIKATGPRAPLAFRAILTLPQPSAFRGLANGFDGQCPCCRRSFSEAAG
jgi:hypothetical protein